MKKFTVDQVPTAAGTKFAAFDSRGKQIGTRVFDEQWECNLAAVHWACAPSLPKRLNLKKINGVFTGRPFGGVRVDAMYNAGKYLGWRAECTIDGERVTYIGKTQKAVFLLINAHGDDEKITRNILNPASREIKIARRDWGGCCDPGTETYHCM